ncbi:MAG: Gfo/Idh/MocA family oxidoreductase [Lentimicrobiaceae bacterium]|nr:Gfo/Idh/MocA family oxidoreductase [Lentimicrobiaceae bacterium]
MFNIGIIGCGKITQVRHAPEYKNNPHCKIIGFFDSNHDRAESLAALYGAKAYPSVHDILCDERIDAVSICTPNNTHAEYAMEAMSHGKHVLCEKPMACSVKEAKEIIDAAEKYKRKLFVGFNQRYFPAHVKAKEILAQGSLGKAISFRTTFKHAGPEGWSIDGDNNTWFFNRQMANFGALIDLGIHKIDLMEWLFGTLIEKVSAQCLTLHKRDNRGNLIEVDDNSFLTLHMSNGAVGTVEVSWTNYGPEENGTVIHCENGTMSIYNHKTYDLIVNYKNKEQIMYNAKSIPTNEAQTSSGVIDAFIDFLMNDSDVLYDPNIINSMSVVESAIISAENAVVDVRKCR